VGRALGVRRDERLERKVPVARDGLQEDYPAPGDPIAELDECRPEPSIRARPCQQLGVPRRCSGPQLTFEVLKRSAFQLAHSLLKIVDQVGAGMQPILPSPSCSKERCLRSPVRWWVVCG
jgi:hypothetical protein